MRIQRIPVRMLRHVRLCATVRQPRAQPKLRINYPLARLCITDTVPDGLRAFVTVLLMHGRQFVEVGQDGEIRHGFKCGHGDLLVNAALLILVVRVNDPQTTEPHRYRADAVP